MERTYVAQEFWQQPDIVQYPGQEHYESYDETGTKCDDPRSFVGRIVSFRFLVFLYLLVCLFCHVFQGICRLEFELDGGFRTVESHFLLYCQGYEDIVPCIKLLHGNEPVESRP